MALFASALNETADPSRLAVAPAPAALSGSILVPGANTLPLSLRPAARDPRLLFRAHLVRVYAELGTEPPAELKVPIIPARVVWTFSRQITRIGPADVLVVQTNCPGQLVWQVDGRGAESAALTPVGGVMAGVARHQISIGPVPGARELTFRSLCRHKGCDCSGPCCRPTTFRVGISGC